MKTWKIKPYKNEPDYVTVKLYSTIKCMRRGYRRSEAWLTKKSRVDLRGYGEIACFRGFLRQAFRDGKWVVVPEWGTVYLNRERLSAGVVAHELAHAAFSCPIVKRIKDHSPQNYMASMREETFCEVVQLMCDEFWKAYNEEKNALQVKKSKGRIQRKVSTRPQI
jgi:hypothetical protein